jgi:undecaprenyl-diphosphatase
VNHQAISAFLLGLLQGLTEFIPISSTGHLILAEQLFGFQGPPGKIFEVVIQLGSAFAVLVAYFDRLYNLAKKVPTSPKDRHFFLMLIVATIPAALLGLVFHHTVKDYLYNPITVACSLIFGGLVFLWIEWLKPSITCGVPENVSTRQAVCVGLAQSVALIPGISRSGATIASARYFGLSPRAATEFSFFLAVPILIGAGFFDLFSYISVLSFNDIISLSAGFISSFISSSLVLRPLIGSIERYGFAPFAYYRIILGVLILWMI